MADAVERNRSPKQEQGIFRNFRQEQACGETSGCEHPKDARDSNQLHHRSDTFRRVAEYPRALLAVGGVLSAIATLLRVLDRH